jgi:hypothetical protein
MSCCIAAIKFCFFRSVSGSAAPKVAISCENGYHRQQSVKTAGNRTTEYQGQVKKRHGRTCWTESNFLVMSAMSLEGTGTTSGFTADCGGGACTTGLAVSLLFPNRVKGGAESGRDSEPVSDDDDITMSVLGGIEACGENSAP